MRNFMVLSLTMGFLWLSQGLSAASEPLIETTTCPEQNSFTQYRQERFAKSKVRFWFGGGQFRWTPMSLIVSVPMPYNSDALPVLAVTGMTLTHYKEHGDWTITCTYMENSGFGIAENTPTTTLTLMHNEVKSCSIDQQKREVTCEMLKRL